MLLRFKLIPHEILQRLRLRRRRQLPLAHLLDVTSHVTLDRCECCGSEHIEEGGEGFGGFEEGRGGYGIVSGFVGRYVGERLADCAEEGLT